MRFDFALWKPQPRVWWEMLKIGLPAGAEFALMGIYMAVVYAITKPFGAAAQGGFTIGLRIVQSAFLPVIALGFAVAPVAGQNFAARKGDRVRAAFKAAASMAAVAMLISGIGIYLAAEPLMRIFTTDAEVTAVGVEYLHIVVPLRGRASPSSRAACFRRSAYHPVAGDSGCGLVIAVIRRSSSPASLVST